MLSLQSRLSEVSGVGPNFNRQLQHLGLNTIYDLLFHIPLRYEDFSRLITINQLIVGQQATVRGKINVISSRRARHRRLNITEALISDTTGSIKAVWFNQAYLSKTLTPGSEVFLAGKINSSIYGLQLEQPIIEPIASGGLHTARIVPFYSLTGTITHKQIRALLNKILPLIKQISDWLPHEVLKLTQLPSLAKTLTTLHFPASQTDLRQSRKRLIFNELFILHLQAKLARQTLNQTNAPYIPFSKSTKIFVNQLPWILTADQKIAAWEIIKDLSQTQPMYRLLQGDVGSGKTVVAGIAALNAVEADYQVVLMAPTQILAEQHFNTLSKMFTNWPIRLGLLTSGICKISPHNSTTATNLKNLIKQGQINITIGTQAVLQKSVNFKKLGLVIVDEQHRFGVEQRGVLTSNQNSLPHFLSLTATPIPRSLALTIFGELDISVLKHLPAGRQIITTKIIAPEQRPSAYKLMAKEIEKGNRVFIVCPLIEESDNLGVRAATTEYERLQKNIFPQFKIGLLHGKLSNAQKSAVMQKFKNGETPLLVTTSVIEVGVDVPEATVMVIEGAERFGIAQLHQFRGRVGRSNLPSHCLLLSDTPNPLTYKRLQSLVQYNNGFDLAEFDLAQRGPGDLLGELQSGWGKLRFAELADVNLLKLVRQSADLIYKIDPLLGRWPELTKKLSETTTHLE